MAKAQQRSNTKSGKKGSKKKIVDPFLRKEWYQVRAPSTFPVNLVGHTIVTKSQGTKLASDGLKGRVYEVNMGNLTRSEETNFRKVKLSCEVVKGTDCLTDFHGADVTRDKLCSLIRKWYSLIEASVDVTTTDGFVLRLFPIAFTARRTADHNNSKVDVQTSQTCYAQTAQIKAIRKKMTETLLAEVSKLSLSEVVTKLSEERIVNNRTVNGLGKSIAKAASTVFPLQNVMIRKVKVLKKPKLDIIRLMNLHKGSVSESKNVVAEGEAAKNLME